MRYLVGLFALILLADGVFWLFLDRLIPRIARALQFPLPPRPGPLAIWWFHLHGAFLVGVSLIVLGAAAFDWYPPDLAFIVILMPFVASHVISFILFASWLKNKKYEL